MSSLTPSQLAAIAAELSTPGGTIARALRGACGGRTPPPWAWTSLDMARATDPALAALCDAAEERLLAGGKAPQRNVVARDTPERNATQEVTVHEKDHGNETRGIVVPRVMRLAGLHDRPLAQAGAPGSTREGSQGQADGAGKALQRSAAQAREPTLASGAFPRVEPEDGPWARACEDAAELAPGHFGTLLWIDARCQLAGMHALDAWWLGTLRAFYDSGKLVLVCRVGLRGAKSVSVCRSLVNDALFGRCNIDRGTVPVIPIMSADRTEATDRFHTIKAILGACGVRSKKGEDDGTVVGGGLGLEYVSKTLPSGGGVIEVQDVDGRGVEFRIYPARIAGVIGHTDKAGFGDEIDTWPVDLGVSDADVATRSAGGRANPADVVLDRWLERFTTTRTTAHLYLVSASYFGHETAHARRVKDGDTEIQMVARLGELGARRDEEHRRRLAALIGSTDPRLLAPADPMSTDIPAWATSPAASIESCYALSRSRLGPMFGRYGGRPDEAEGSRGPLAGVEILGMTLTDAPLDTVIGLAPGATWGRVTVRITRGALVVTGDEAGADPLAPDLRASVLACATPQEGVLRAECSTWLAGRPGAYLPPVAPQDVYDGRILRLSPLRTLYERGVLRHAPGLEKLADALRVHHAESDRDPRLEALVAAVSRLVACYPWIGAAPDEKAAEPLRSPRLHGGVLESREDPSEVTRPGWAR